MSAEARQFVDTNVLIYAYDTTAASKHRVAQELLIGLWDSGSGSLSIQVLQEFFVTVTRKIPRPLTLSEARGVVEKLTLWHVHRPEPVDVLRAIDLQASERLSFWDAMILRSAAALACSRVWSEDLNPGQRYQGIPVVNPFL